MEIGNLVLQSAINVGINPPYDFTSYIQTKWREFEKQYESPTPKLQYFLTNMMYPDVKRSSPETEYLFCVPAENVWTQYIRIKIMDLRNFLLLLFWNLVIVLEDFGIHRLFEMF